MPLKKPSELFEERRKESLAEELAQKQKLEEDKTPKNKKIVSPKELFGEVKVEEEVVIEEPLIVEEIVEEPVDPYLEEIGLLRDDLEKVVLSIPEETDLTKVFQYIQILRNRIDNLPKQKEYSGDIESIREELVRIEGSIPVPEVFDPSDLYENISALKNKLEEVRLEIPTIPEPILYDDQLNQLKEMVVGVRNSIPVVPEIRYYEDELNEIVNAIEGVRAEIPEIPELPEIKYYDDQISIIESRLVEIQDSIPTVKYYDDELGILDQKIAEVKESIPVVPEVKYYDKDVKELKEKIDSVEKSIPVVPEVRYYDEDVKGLKEEIDSVKKSIPVVPEVRYYDEDIKGLNEEVHGLYKKVSAIKIPDQGKYLKEVKEIYSTFEEKNHKLLEKVKYLEEVFEKFNEETLTEGLLNEPPDVKNSDPLTPLDQNFVTLDQLKEHYRLFINRIQQQLSTIGGGGETRLEFLDDIDRTSAKVNGRYLKYDAARGKWIGALGGGGAGSQTLEDTLDLGNTSTLGMSVGVTTTTRLIVDPVGGGTTFVENLVVKGNARVTGILSIGTGTIVLDPNDNAIVLADVKIRRDNSTGDIRFLDTGGNLTSIVANTVTVGAGNSSVSLVANDGGIVVANNNGNVVANVGITSTTSINTSGIVTASRFVGDGSFLTGINPSIPLSAITDIDTSNLSSISTDYIMVYDPTILKFKFVDPKTYFGINNDYNPAPDIVDYGSY